MSRFLDAKYAGMLPYVPGEQPQGREYVKLNTNENPYPPAPGVMEALNAAQVGKLNLYSDPDCRELYKALAQNFGVGEDQVIVGNGSDEILAFAFLAFCEKGVAYPDLSYGFYPVFAELFGVNAKEVPLREDFSLAPEDYAGLGRTVVIANPNAPTGLALSLSQIEQLAKSNPDNLLLVDEAYVDFGAESAVALLDRLDNLLVVGTFSKSRSLAGMRVGYAVSSKEIIADLNKMKFSFNPYNVDRLAQLAAKAALEDRGYFDRCRNAIMDTREAAAKRLKELGFSVLPSKANFLFAAHGAIDGESLYRKLKDRGVLVRHFKKPRIQQYVRITIGTPEQMDALFSAVKDILEEKP